MAAFAQGLSPDEAALRDVGVTTEQENLWRRIEAFQLDAPGAAQSFSARLAHEQGWSAAHARRVIGEYKRFVFLAIAAGHPVSPSKAVDEAWHLHLIHTRSYWEEFCPHALGRPLHHEPSRGGGDEEKKFAGWYARTRASYREFFGEEPPADIWPAPVAEATPTTQMPGRPRAWLVAAGLSLGLTGCVGALGWPLDLPGPEFLGFFFFWSVSVLVAAGLLRYWLRKGTDAQTEALPEGDANAAALLAGGSRRVTEMVLANLYRRGLLRVDRKKRHLLAEGELPPNATAVERALHAKAVYGATLKGLCEKADPLLQANIERLVDAGLLLSEEQGWRARWWPGVVASLAPAVGVVKVCVGLSRDRPVSFLIIGCLVTGLFALGFFMVRARRTWAGDRALAATRARHSVLQKRPLGADGANLAELSLAVALFGATVLPAAGMKDLRNLVGQSGANGSGFGCSSCGGGGGGGGGGGCGGCGGGGH